MEGYDSDIFKAKRGKFFCLILLLIKNMFDILKNVVAIIWQLNKWFQNMDTYCAIATSCERDKCSKVTVN